MEADNELGGRITMATKVGIRDFRQATSTWIRRAESGERIIVTVNGSAVAQITELNKPASQPSRSLELEDLVLTGLVDRPANGAHPIQSVDSGGSGERYTADLIGAGDLGTVAADVQVDRILAYVRGQQVRSR